MQNFGSPYRTSVRHGAMGVVRVMAVLGVLGGCATDGSGPGSAAPPDIGTASRFAYRPMAFARVGSAGGVGTGFNSASATGGVTVTYTPPGRYVVSFAGLGTTSSADGNGGQVQVTAEGTSNVRCRILGWGGSVDLAATIECTTPAGALADSAFAALYFRDAMPAPSTQPIDAAYLWYPGSGGSAPYYDYNASGTHNTVTPLGTGSYQIAIPHATSLSASMMVTAYGGTSTGAAVCSISSWGAGITFVECRNATNQLIDSAFSFSYAIDGPTFEQQGAHAWFNGSAADPTYSAALGKVEGCSPASVTASRVGPLVTTVVSGDIGPWDTDVFLRASFTSKYGSAGYCKVEKVNASGAAPSSTATTTMRCYDPTGAVVANPQLTFTHVTSDAAGPC